MNTTFTCSLCHEVRPIDDQRMFRNQPFCQCCYNSETVICDHCGERIWATESITDGTITLCRTCREEQYVRCHVCDRLIPTNYACYPYDGDDPYCSTCANCEEPDEDDESIHDYGYKPKPIFYGNGCRYLGVELEIDDAGEDNDSAEEILYIANRNADHVYCKHDGSLDEGFEIVTHPMTLEYHMQSMPWERVMSRAISLDYRSHQAETCGLHVHVNRDSLGNTIQQQEDTIARILFFVENHWNELLRFSRRTQSQMDRWAARYGRKDSPKELMTHVKEKYPCRYACVNLINENTIEFRMFRGTLRYSTLIATLQLVNEICEVAFCSFDSMMEQMTWLEFVSHLDQHRYPELIQYLKERRLYVSEPVAGEEEV